MYVEVDLMVEPADVVLRDPDDFGSLKVVVRGAREGPAALYAALEGVGHLDGDGNALLQTDALRRLAGRLARDPDWQRSFERMVSYAAARGWVARGGNALQAHCEWRRD